MLFTKASDKNAAILRRFTNQFPLSPRACVLSIDSTAVRRNYECFEMVDEKDTQALMPFDQ